MPAKPSTRTRGGAAKKSSGAQDTKSARTRGRILDAAAKVLSTKGYAGMRLGDVATEAEIQPPAIYYYFDSREHLVEEVMWVGLAQMRAHLTEALEAAADLDPMERIMVAVEAHLRHELELSDYATASIRNAAQIPDSIRERADRETVQYGEVWRGLVRAAIDEGQVNPDLDPYVAQMLALGALNWAAEWWSPRRGSLDSVVAMAQAFVRNGLAPQD
ncbi:TetR/AcrR family transcriptional regulator [Nocardioides sp. NPDC092400]|uniref:TetR/AcrR family transcriptional regulator n=1 Tax=Nocardioides sp. NPDC092400 TaxID=3155196 RepID=UPI00342C3B98